MPGGRAATAPRPLGIPVFIADVKGDITGMCAPGKDSEDMQERIARFGIEGFTYEGCPCRFWDMLGDQGIPVRITISDMCPSLLSLLLELTEEAEKAAEREARAAEKQQEQIMRGIGKFAGQIFGTFGREATRQITRNLFGGRRR